MSGNAVAVRPRFRGSLDFLIRFWGKVTVGPGCWIWRGTRLPRGYGRYSPRHGRTVYAHRLAYELQGERIPDGLIVCHHCDTPSCVNPAHLFVGTHQDNVDDCVRKKRMHLGNKHGLRLHPECANPLRGEAHPCAKLTAHDVRQLRRLRADGISFATLAQRFGIGKTQAQGIVARRKWAHVS